MYICEKRLGIAYAIQVVDEIGIQEVKLKWWLNPFFMLESNLGEGVLLATITITKDVNLPISYTKTSAFYIDGKMSENCICYNILYVVRAVFKNLAARFGYTNIHAGCISCGNIGILIKAKRNQGKTTLLLHSLISGNFQLVANDQVMFKRASAEALGYPAVVGIRNNSCADVFQRKLLQKALWMSGDPYQESEKPIVHISDLRSIFDCRVEAEATIGVVLEYEKSTIDDELLICSSSWYKGDFTELVYPLSEIYGEDIFNASLDCLEKVDLNLTSRNLMPVDPQIQLVKVKCGVNCINDLLQEMQYIVQRRK